MFLRQFYEICVKNWRFFSPLILSLLTSSDDVFHNLVKEDHRQPPPTAPRNGSAGLNPLPPLSGPTLPPTPATHLPTMASQPFPKMATPAPDFMEAHQGLCLPPTEPPASSADCHISAPPSVCRYERLLNLTQHEKTALN